MPIEYATSSTHNVAAIDSTFRVFTNVIVANGVYVLEVDLTGMASGDEVEIVFNHGEASAAVNALAGAWTDDQDNPRKILGPWVLAGEDGYWWVRQPAGVEVSFDWQLKRIYEA